MKMTHVNLENIYTYVLYLFMQFNTLTILILEEFSHSTVAYLSLQSSEYPITTGCHEQIIVVIFWSVATNFRNMQGNRNTHDYRESLVANMSQPI